MATSEENDQPEASLTIGRAVELAAQAQADVERLAVADKHADAVQVGLEAIKALTVGGYAVHPATVRLQASCAKSMAEFGQGTALRLLDSALGSAITLGDDVLQATCQLFVAHVHERWQDFDSAVAHLYQARELFEAVNATGSLFIVANNLSRALSGIGDFAKAAAESETAIALLASGEVRRSERRPLSLQTHGVYAYNNYAEALVGLGDYEKARVQLRHARDLLDENDNRLGRIYNERIMGVAAQGLGDDGEAVASLLTSVRLATEARLPLEIEKSLLLLADAQMRAGDPAGAFASIKNAHGFTTQRLNALTQSLAKATEREQRTFESADGEEDRSDPAGEVSPGASRSLQLLAHDLRAPLAAVNLVIESAERTTDNAHTASLLAQGAQAVETINRMLGQMLGSITGSGRQRARLEPEDIAESVSEAIVDVQALAAAKSIRLATRLRSYVVLVDRSLVSHILNNLLSNAIKFSEIDSEVVIDIRREGGDIRVSVKDNGVGIHSDEVSALFGESGRLQHSQPTAGEESLGVGLRLAALQAAIMEARIEVHSDGLGKGATFTLVLPATQAGEVKPPCVSSPSPT